MKRIISVVLTLCMLLVCTAEQGLSVGIIGGADGPTAIFVANNANFPRTLTDAAGRKVTVPAQPERIVSGYYISTSLLMALGQSEKLVGVEAKANTRPIYALAAPRILSLPSVGTAKQFDLEACLSLEPDLVVLPMKLKESASILEELGIPALLVNPESMEGLKEAAVLLAGACGTSCEGILAFYADCEARLSAALDGAQRPDVYIAGNSSWLRTAGADMYQTALTEMAGGHSVSSEIPGSAWVDISQEQLLAWNPDYVILAADAVYTVEDFCADLMNASLDAVKNGRVFRMPSQLEAWDSPVPGGVMGALWTAKTLHGDRISEEEYMARVQEFYGMFYGLSAEDLPEPEK